MFENGFFSNIFYASENPAIINIKKTIKENGELKTIIDSNKYELSSITVKSKDDIKYSLLHNFFVKLNFKSNRKELKYFNRGFIKNLFTKKNPNIILDEILEYDWIITTPNIINEISSHFIEQTESNTMVKLRGYFTSQFKNTLVFELPDQYSDNIIYCGYHDSITPIINTNTKNIKNDIVLEYQFLSKENLKKIFIL
jgi:hypothetical protein